MFSNIQAAMCAREPLTHEGEVPVRSEMTDENFTLFRIPGTELLVPWNKVGLGTLDEWRVALDVIAKQDRIF